MVSGFLIRHDGALISIDHIIFIDTETRVRNGGSDTETHIHIHLREGHTVRWNKNPLGEDSTRVLLHELRTLIKKAIEL